MRGIVSVYDKTGLEELAAGLDSLGVELVSTGGTLRTLQDAGIAARSVSEVTGFPEILEGRVKTLHPAIHAGVLARRSRPEDMAQLVELGIGPFDVVAVNLYPFAKTVAQPGTSLEVALDNIDIGGPALVRAAAKNFTDMVVLVDPEDYRPVLQEWREHGAVSVNTRRWLAAKAFSYVSAYDALVSQYLQEDSELFPEVLTVSLKKVQELRYGENPHQRGALYRERGASQSFIDRLQQVGGKELSFNNVLDAHTAAGVVADFLGPTVAIIKHGVPCGLATNPDLELAFEHALMGDPQSAFGGVVAANRPIEGQLAETMSKTFFELILAPSFSQRALEVFRGKRNLRLLEVGELTASWEAPTTRSNLDWKRVSGGFLLQTPDNLPPDEVQTEIVTRRHPTLEETTDLLFAWRAVEHVRSNAIVLAKDLSLVGVGSGQPSRVDAVKLAAMKADLRARDSVMASDAFFPFPDGIEEAAKAGVTAVIQPGGSVRDDEVIRAADHHGMAMLFTGTRHFRH
ncbi:MAG: bifunctional phosphoribosylaminoimidazolecarboxamide formyltransferase/IMP cyclohydrolase [Chloroflexota bacterium]|nr:bifunctional phosphoribosylaminoimidazolecarboxamide formyltransferase/IMP cyclohydrolase [Chloroflexota bacterium]